MKWDVFISHAFEDKEYARELADALSKSGVKVWFDEFELHIGDSLSRSISHGLSESSYGIVILSRKFFQKEWTQKELGALTSRETTNKKVILPIWLNIDSEEIIRYSPILADRFAISSIVGINKIVELLFLEIKGESLGTIDRGKRKRSVFEVDLEFTKKIAINKEIEMNAVMEQAMETSRMDPTTFFLNRRTILNDLQNQIFLSERQKTPLSVILLSLDIFNDFRKNQGSWTAIDILREVSHNIRDFIPKSQSIGRIFAEEFLIIIPNKTIKDASIQAQILCEHIRNHPINVDGQIFFTTISASVTSYKIGEERLDDFINRVYELLIQVQSNGGNQWLSS